MSILGINGMLERIYQNTLKNSKTTAGSGTAFKEKLSGAKEVTSFEDMWKSKFPGAYYNVMDTSKIDGSLWGRNDYPWEKYFTDNADKSLLDWKPSGAEPAMSDPKVQARIRSTIGKKSIIVPPALEEKMNNNPQLAKEVMDRVETFISKQDSDVIHIKGYFQNPCNGYLIALDENGEIAHSCVTSESISVSSSEFAEANKKRRERQYQFNTEQNKKADYTRILEESALKRSQFIKAINNKNTAKGVLLGAYKSNFFYK
ncbi:MAG: hypothetical protein HFE59_05880 [Clostridiales bacterium]|nr:hypothetical protein [Clostridiales bacterium]